MLRQRQTIFILSTLFLLVPLVTLRANEQTAPARPPNFIIVFCDDMGYADIGPFGAEGYETPHLDRMATEGMKFTDFYVGRSFCTPSRAALMTGCIPTRVGIGGNFGPKSTTGLNPNEMTILTSISASLIPTTCGHFIQMCGIFRWKIGSNVGRTCPCMKARRSSIRRSCPKIRFP